MSVKRYDGMEADPCEDGNFVTHDDYAALQLERDRLEKAYGILRNRFVDAHLQPSMSHSEMEEILSFADVARRGE